VRLIDWSSTSIIHHVFLQDSISGDPKTGLLFSQTGLAIYGMRNGDSTPTTFTLETITTIGTWVSPTSSAHVRFKEVGTIPGLYELQFHNDLFVTSSPVLNGVITCSDIILPCPFAFQLDRSITIKKNRAFSNFMFWLEDSSNPGLGKTGLTFNSGSAQVAIDGGAFANLTNTPTEVSDGWYKINLAAGDVNGSCIAFKFVVTGARERHMSVVTQN
jgi:hypothetical protein